MTLHLYTACGVRVSWVNFKRIYSAGKKDALREIFFFFTPAVRHLEMRMTYLSFSILLVLANMKVENNECFIRMGVCVCV